MVDCSDAAIKALVGQLVDPISHRPLAQCADLQITEVDAAPQLTITLHYPHAPIADPLQQLVQDRLQARAAGWPGKVVITSHSVAHKPQRDLPPHPKIKNVLAIGSGKGGVGKSTVAVNFAAALQHLGLKVGLLDADIHGPSVPTMVGQQGGGALGPEQALQPVVKNGMPVQSIGFLLADPGAPASWRGPMQSRALLQLFTETNWPELDCLVIDLPPGTGDIHLSLGQKIPISGAIIVTTPQTVARVDAHKALGLFRKLAVPILGIIENMSTHICTQCGHAEAIFGSGGGQELADMWQIPLLGQLPLAPAVRQCADQGVPAVLHDPSSPVAQSFCDLALAAYAQLAARPRELRLGIPTTLRAGD